MTPACPYVLVEISPGELLDRLTILRIKRERVLDADKLRNVERELSSIENTSGVHVPRSEKLDELITELTAINEGLWSAEDRIRQCQAAADRDGFIECSEVILRLNDKRCAAKREINLLLGSIYLEEKSYGPGYAAGVTPT